MKQIFFIAILTFWLPSFGHAETANQIMDEVISGYFGDRNYSEHWKAKVKTNSWEKDLSMWANYGSGEALFVLDPDKNNFSGTLFVPGDVLLGFDVHVNPNGRGGRLKSGSFADRANGTENSYFDFLRMIRVGKMKYEFVNPKKKTIIKGTPQGGAHGDYSCLIFFLNSDKSAVKAIKYFKGKRWIKTQTHENIEWLKVSRDQKVWRPKGVHVEQKLPRSSKKNPRFTHLKITKRSFQIKAFKINEEALEEGRLQ